ncbi:uncharacterized protein BJ212DRAFT_1279243 [Suillus subaureus]|uniref:Protein kinase domain-containing protein n=1 Tax=Suillus subaureus TaxID=48587 RepID=A0A9P7E322_9AGAM|nr:uncharacterized protein BJ212DRAFT_1279243 [Suillus subaureus]KAG1809594.1 hypothetical protein BJ212DRAFT_1279243 [Suillus subaureus]
MTFVSIGLPSHIRSSLEVNLLATLEHPHLLEVHDTRLSGGPQFQAIHLSWYNRHCTKANVQPWLLEKAGMHTNHGQVIPYISLDLQQHQRIYVPVFSLMKILPRWISQCNI